jgi:hypothetical protein
VSGNASGSLGSGKTSLNLASVLPDNRLAHLPQIPRQFFLCYKSNRGVRADFDLRSQRFVCRLFMMGLNCSATREIIPHHAWSNEEQTASESRDRVISSTFIPNNRTVRQLTSDLASRSTPPPNNSTYGKLSASPCFRCRSIKVQIPLGFFPGDQGFVSILRDGLVAHQIVMSPRTIRLRRTARPSVARPGRNPRLSASPRRQFPATARCKEAGVRGPLLSRQ